MLYVDPSAGGDFVLPTREAFAVAGGIHACAWSAFRTPSALKCVTP